MRITIFPGTLVLDVTPPEGPLVGKWVIPYPVLPTTAERVKAGIIQRCAEVGVSCPLDLVAALGDDV